ncbi:MAG: hypothetical protein HY795_05170 [Desulfovibrio sp.]|nr:hypothetical protein [Desulfovibrio sp.]MBI4960338.1 hypothetical protein [Desulfovibrio sp.]
MSWDKVNAHIPYAIAGAIGGIAAILFLILLACIIPVIEILKTYSITKFDAILFSASVFGILSLATLYYIKSKTGDKKTCTYLPWLKLSHFFCLFFFGIVLLSLLHTTLLELNNNVTSIINTQTLSIETNNNVHDYAIEFVDDKKVNISNTKLTLATIENVKNKVNENFDRIKFHALNTEDFLYNNHNAIEKHIKEDIKTTECEHDAAVAFIGKGRFSIMCKEDNITIALNTTVQESIAKYISSYKNYSEPEKKAIADNIRTYIDKRFYSGELYGQLYKASINISFIIILATIAFYTTNLIILEHRNINSQIADNSNNNNGSHNLTSLQLSLDRSILRYNTLGFVLFFVTIVVVLISGILAFSLFSNTINDIKSFTNEKNYSASIVLLYIMRTSLLTAFLTTTIIVFYKFSRSAVDQSARFLKRKHATKFLRYLIEKIESEKTLGLNQGYMKKFYNTETMFKYLPGDAPPETFEKAVSEFLGGDKGMRLNINNALDSINSIINTFRRIHLLPELDKAHYVTPADIYFKSSTCKKFKLIPFGTFVELVYIRSIAGIDKHDNKLNIDSFEKLMKAFESWNTDIGSAFGEGSAQKKSPDSSSINLNIFRKNL